MTPRPWCECAREDCQEGLPIDEYTYVSERARYVEEYRGEGDPPMIYLVIAGHESPGDEVIRRGVAKKGPAAGEGYTVVRSDDER